jgi:CHAT domain-containing protein
MKKVLDLILSYSFLILVLYSILSLVHISWYIANPEGFFGFGHFTDIIRVFLTITILLAIIMFVGVMLISYIIGLFQKKSRLKDLFKIIGVFAFLLFMTIFNSIWVGGASYLFSSKMSEKYSLINRTEKLLKKGDTEEALDLAIESYIKEKDRDVNSFFILTKLYSSIDYDKKEKELAKYASTINYGYTLMQMYTDNEKAEELFKEAISISSSEWLENDRSDLQVFPNSSLAIINLNAEKFKVADHYINELYKLHEESTDEDIIYLIKTYSIFAAKAIAIGDIAKSIALNKRMLKLYEESELSKSSKNYLSLLLSVSAVKLYEKNFTGAAELLVKAEPIAEDNDDSSIYLDYLRVKGNYCLIAAINDQGDERLIESSFWNDLTTSSNESLNLKKRLLKQAENCFHDIVEMSEDLGGSKSIQYLNSNVTLANYYYVTSQFTKAKSIFQKSLLLVENFKNENAVLYYDLYLKNLLNESHISPIQIKQLSEVEEFIFGKLNDNFIVLTEEEKEFYAIYMHSLIDKVNSFYIIEDSEFSRIKLHNNITSIKGLALSSNANIRNYIANADNDIKKNYHKLLEQKKAYKMNSSISKNLEDEEILRKNEKALLKQINEDPTFTPFQPQIIDWTQTKSLLGSDDVVIEIFNLSQNLGSKKETKYYALVTTSESKSPELTELFNEIDLKNLLNAKGDTEEQVKSIYDTNGGQIYDLIFSKINHQLNDNSTIYISKSGLMHNISIPALFKDKKWDVHVIENSKYLNEPVDPVEHKKVVLFGGIDYNVDSIMIKSDKRFTKSLDNKFPDLHYTFSEVNNISKLFSSDSSNTSKVFSSALATELAFKTLSGAKTDIIHIATHGFYNKSESINSFAFNNINDGQMPSSTLLRSGLLFAGANNANYADSNNDGIMTSLEISGLDFSQVDLIVLSACETGLGEVLGSEGVFGLQRAFKLAGAKSLIVSLWQVPDKQTAELMIKFYDYHIKGHTKFEALQKAQNDIRANYPNPYFWAGFELLE